MTVTANSRCLACSPHVFTPLCAQTTEQLQQHVQQHPEIDRSMLAKPSADRFPSPAEKTQLTKHLNQMPNAIQYP
jgi:hypothetical protein